MVDSFQLRRQVLFHRPAVLVGFERKFKLARTSYSQLHIHFLIDSGVKCIHTRLIQLLENVDVKLASVSEGVLKEVNHFLGTGGVVWVGLGRCDRVGKVRFGENLKQCLFHLNDAVHVLELHCRYHTDTVDGPHTLTSLFRGQHVEGLHDLFGGSHLISTTVIVFIVLVTVYVCDLCPDGVAQRLSELVPRSNNRTESLSYSSSSEECLHSDNTGFCLLLNFREACVHPLVDDIGHVHLVV